MPPPSAAHHDGLDHKLRQDVAPARAQRLADADFVRALGDAGQHDIHNHDAAHHHEHGHDADGHREDGARELVPEVHDGMRRR